MSLLEKDSGNNRDEYCTFNRKGIWGRERLMLLWLYMSHDFDMNEINTTYTGLFLSSLLFAFTLVHQAFAFNVVICCNATACAL